MALDYNNILAQTNAKLFIHDLPGPEEGISDHPKPPNLLAPETIRSRRYLPFYTAISYSLAINLNRYHKSLQNGNSRAYHSFSGRPAEKDITQIYNSVDRNKKLPVINTDHHREFQH